MRKLLLGILLMMFAGSFGVVHAVTDVPWICNDDNTLPPYSSANIQNTIIAPVTGLEKKGELFYSWGGGSVRKIALNASISGVAGNGDLRVTIYPIDQEYRPVLSNPLAGISKSAAGLPVGSAQTAFDCDSPLGYQTYILDSLIYLAPKTFYFITAEIEGSPKTKSWYWWSTSGQADTMPYSYPWETNTGGTGWGPVTYGSTSGTTRATWDYQFGLIGDPGATLPNHWLVSVPNAVDLSGPLGYGVYMLGIAALMIFLCMKMSVPVLPSGGLLFLTTLALMSAGIIERSVILLFFVFASLVVIAMFVTAVMNKGGASEET